MRKSQIESQIVKYILPAHSSYFVQQYVMYAPFGNNFFLKGYLFYSKGDIEDGLKVTFFVLPLFVKLDAISYTIGEELSYTRGEGIFKKTRNIWWDVRKENQESTFQKISDIIAKQGEPILNKFNSSHDFFKYQAKKTNENIRVYEEAAYSSILFADEKTQDRMLKKLIREADNERNLEWINQVKEDAKLLLSINGTEKRITILKQWVNESIENLKLSKLLPFIC